MGCGCTAKLLYPSRFTCLHTRLPCPPAFLGGLEFASWSPRWHWRLCLAQPAITLPPWTIAVGFWEPFHFFSFQNNAFSSRLCPYRLESRGEWETPCAARCWVVRPRECGCGKVLHCPGGLMQGYSDRTRFSTFIVDRLEKTLWFICLHKT